MCVADARTCVFNAFVSIAKVFISNSNAFVSNAKTVHPQHKTRSSLAINMFVCSVIRNLEVNSKDYLVASDERIRLQCEIIFGGE